MRCDDCRELLGARLDDELPHDDVRDVDAHVASCAECAGEYRELMNTHRLVSGAGLRYIAPDLLKVRIRGALAQRPETRPGLPARRNWWPSVAAAVCIVVVSSVLTYTATRPSRTNAVAEEIVASHVRSLLPGHLTDIVSTNQHNVKPWFNGRVDLSPPVPDLSASNFTLVGGRVDYVAGRTVSVVVYSRRQHLINVYSWPATDVSVEAPRTTSRNGYHLMSWRRDGLQEYAVSDLNEQELRELVAAFER